ncbi:MAG: polysaccharide biosynthesis tyrosine autokinase [Lachnospiraceae bacterium]
MSNQGKEKNQEEGLIDIIEITLKYLQVFRRIWWNLLILVLLMTGLAVVRGKRQDVSRYTAYTVFTVSSGGWGSDGTEISNYYDNVTAEQMSSAFPHILTSDLLRKRVAGELGTPTVPGNIQVTATENTNMMTISVTDTDAQRAYDTLQAIITYYPEIAEVIIGKTVLNVLDESGVPTAAVHSVSLKHSVWRGFLFGVLLAFVWMTVIVLTRKTICKESDMRKYMNVTCFGSIPVMIRKERSEKNTDRRPVLTNPKVEAILSEPLRMIRNKVEYSAQNSGKKTFLVTSALAGEGKSTIAVNLALTMAGSGERVVLIDCDLRHPTDRTIFGLEEGKGMSEILRGEADMDDCLLDAKALGLDENMNFLFLPGGKPVEDGSELLSDPKLLKIIKALGESADFVIVDTAPVGLLTDALVLAEGIDGAIYIVRRDYAGVNHIIDGMEQLTDHGIEIVGGILNGV